MSEIKQNVVNKVCLDECGQFLNTNINVSWGILLRNFLEKISTMSLYYSFL